MCNPIRVLLISGSYPQIKCGVGDYTAQLARALGRRGDVEVCVVTDADAQFSPDLDQNVQLFPVIHGWKITEISAILRKIISWRPDVVHMQFGSSKYRLKTLPWLMPAFLRMKKQCVIQTWHEWPNDLPRFIRNLPNALVRGGLVVVKPEIEASMSPWYRRLIRKKYFRYIPNASAIPHIYLNGLERSLVHNQLAPGMNRIVAFFGFANPRKGLENIFEIIDPETNLLVLICELDPSNSYHRRLLARINSKPWRGNVVVTGYLPPEKVGRILAAADAVALPFPDGGGVWSTSAHAAVAQGTFVLVTSHTRNGYDPTENVYYAHPGDHDEMRAAMRAYIGRRVTPRASISDQWDIIANAHMTLYRNILVTARFEENSYSK